MTTSTTQNDRSDAASVARRPDALLSRDDTARLSVRSDAIGLAYFFGHFGLIGLGGWLTWQTFPSIASYVPVQKRGLMVIEARILMALYGAIIIAAVVTGFGLGDLLAHTAASRRTDPTHRPGSRTCRLRRVAGPAQQYPHHIDLRLAQRHRLADAVPRRAPPVPECAVSSTPRAAPAGGFENHRRTARLPRGATQHHHDAALAA